MSITAPQVDQDALLADLSAMVQIPSVNYFADIDPDAPPEAAMADYFEKRLLDFGLEVDSKVIADGRRNVWGRLRGTGGGPTIMLAGHMDTVGVEGYDQPFVPKIEDGRIYGRGACDMKAGLAAYLEMLRILTEAGEPLKGDLIVAGVVDEEHAMIGSYDFGLNGPEVDFAIVAEPSELAICPAHKGQVCRSIRCKGVSVHSSMPEHGVNAIAHMTQVLNGLMELSDDLSRRAPDPMCGHPTLSVGVIKGGTNVSSVPDWCEIEVDRRTIPGENLELVTAEYQAILDGIAERLPEFQYELCDPELNVDPFSTPADSPLIGAIEAAVHAETNVAPVIKAFTGSTDAPNFRCAAVICGAGSLAQCHSLNEYVEIEQVVSAVKIYLNTILQLQNP